MTRPNGPGGSSPDPIHPTAGPETVSFGPGGSDVEPATPVVDAEHVHQPGEIDAWYTEPEPGPEVDAEPTWLSERWKAWQRQDRDRRLVIVLATVAVLALLAAFIGLIAADDDTAIELPAVESHGLSADQAACFSYGLIEKRLEARLGTEGFDAEDSSNISAAISQEIDSLDELAGSHPEADYRLITAFAAVADASTVLSDADGFADFQSAVSGHADAVAAANDACSEFAGFDVDELEPN